MYARLILNFCLHDLVAMFVVFVHVFSRVCAFANMLMMMNIKTADILGFRGPARSKIFRNFHLREPVSLLDGLDA